MNQITIIENVENSKEVEKTIEAKLLPNENLKTNEQKNEAIMAQQFISKAEEQLEQNKNNHSNENMQNVTLGSQDFDTKLTAKVLSFSPQKIKKKYNDISLPQDVPAWVLDLIKENNFRNENHIGNEIIPDENEWEVVAAESNLKILQSRVNTQCFKCELKIKMMSGARIYKILLDLETRNLWDDSFDQGKISHFFNSYRHCIIRQVNK